MVKIKSEDIDIFALPLLALGGYILYMYICCWVYIYIFLIIYIIHIIPRAVTFHASQQKEISRDSEKKNALPRRLSSCRKALGQFSHGVLEYSRDVEKLKNSRRKHVQYKKTELKLFMYSNKVINGV